MGKNIDDGLFKDLYWLVNYPDMFDELDEDFFSLLNKCKKGINAKVQKAVARENYHKGIVNGDVTAMNLWLDYKGVPESFRYKWNLEGKGKEYKENAS